MGLIWAPEIFKEIQDEQIHTKTYKSLIDSTQIFIFRLWTTSPQSSEHMSQLELNFQVVSLYQMSQRAAIEAEQLVCSKTPTPK